MKYVIMSYSGRKCKRVPPAKESVKPPVKGEFLFLSFMFSSCTCCVLVEVKQSETTKKRKRKRVQDLSSDEEENTSEGIKQHVLLYFVIAA